MTIMNNKYSKDEKQNKNSRNKNNSNQNSNSHNINKISYLGKKNKNLKKATRLRQLIFQKEKEKESDSIKKILFDNSNNNTRTIENANLTIKNTKRLMINKNKKNKQILLNDNKDNYLGRNRNIDVNYNKNNISPPELIDSSAKKLSFTIMDNIKYIEDINNDKQIENNNKEKELYQLESPLSPPKMNTENNENENDSGTLSFNQVRDIILYNTFSSLNKEENDFIFNQNDKKTFEHKRKNQYFNFFFK